MSNIFLRPQDLHLELLQLDIPVRDKILVEWTYDE